MVHSDFYSLVKSLTDSTNINPSLPLLVNGVLVGHIPSELSPYFLNHSNGIFKLENHQLHLIECKNKEERTQVVEALFLEWRKTYSDLPLFHSLKGWRHERYSLYGLNREILLDVERAACNLIGNRTYGCHLNAYVKRQNSIHMWIGKRALTKPRYPGMLDTMVAGGIASGYTPTETIIKEAEEEAGLDLTGSKVPFAVGVITLSKFSDTVTESSTNYLYDIELDDGFVPIAKDGEVESFQLLSLSEIRDLLFDNVYQFKLESALVIIDFMIRYGFITPDNESSYVELVTSLKKPLPYPGPQ
ncbi:hypothetical protein HDV02_003742 [Globomyces sp. JEL0801]|nr:hypothetical protein HDV02_003742 [Globomyces sp. JEL0801]